MKPTRPSRVRLLARIVGPLASAMLLAACQAGWSQSLAGTGASGSTGDGGSAVLAKLVAPASVLAIAGGGFYVADTSACVIRKVDPSGTISTVAGTGTCGESGDGGRATAAQIRPFCFLPQVGGMALGVDGSLYFVSQATPFGPNCDIRRVGSSGTITTVVPPTGSELVGGLTAAPDGTLYYSAAEQESGFHVNAISPGGVDTVVFTESAVGSQVAAVAYVGPGSLAVEVLQDGAFAVDRLSLGTATLAPSGLTCPTVGTVAAAPDGTIYEGCGNTVLRVTPAGLVATIAGDGTADPATTAQAGLGTALALTPLGLALTPHDGLLISSGHVVYRLQSPADAG